VSARLLSLNVGLPRDVAWRGRTVHTAVWKAPVRGRRMVRRLNIDGDGQGDLAGHGGENRAVYVYQLGSYRHWENVLGRSDLTYGQFGENFTVEGLADSDVFIGDRYRIGGALFEVTQPRVTCYRIGMRMDEPRMAALLVSHGRPGFYFRVLEEGEVEAGDEVVQVAAGAERMTVADINALLYLPGHPRAELERALRIPALSPGWRGSLAALLEQERSGTTAAGNAGLAPLFAPPPAWPGFRALRVSQKVRESRDVTSLVLEPTDGRPLSAALPGQFVILKLQTRPDAAPLLRSYSLSGEPSVARYRLSIKREAHGAAGSFIDEMVKVGDALDTSAAHGAFTLRPGDGPVVLISAGIGATPVLAMLHALVAQASRREVWWLHGARNRAEHSFAAETRALVKALSNAHSHIRYSAPAPNDRPGVDFDARGHLDIRALQEVGVPREAEFYVCGPTAFMNALTAGLAAWGFAANRINTEIFGSAPSITPGIAVVSSRKPHLPDGPPGTGPVVSFARSGLHVRWAPKFQSLLELAEACDVPSRWSCRTGVCHTCETALIAGSVAYRPDPIDAPADGNFLACCSQPQSDVVIDL